MYRDRIKDTTTSTGTGAIVLDGAAPTGYQTFASGFGGSSQTVAYCIADQSGANWEVGTGTFNGTTGLTRVTVLGSSNAGSLVNFTAGTKDVFCTAPASYLLPQGATTQVPFNDGGLPGSNANFTYDKATNTLTLGNITGSALGITIQALPAIAGQTPGDVQLIGNASQDATTAGGIRITGGAATTPSTGAGGAIVITGGAATSAAGGSVALRGGAGTVGGNVNLTGGAGSAGAGGGFTLGTGAGTTASGNVSIGTASGGASGNSGKQAFSTGNATVAAGTSGVITLTTGNASGAGGVAGDISLTGGTANNAGTGANINLRPGAGATTRGSLIFKNTLGTSALKITDDATNTQIGFFNVTPVVQQATAATATDLATVITLANALKTAMTNLGLTN